jgi:hypothetical protein
MSLPQRPYATSAYRAEAIPPLPAPPRARERTGEDLLPFGDYAGIEPYQQLCDDAELVKCQEQKDPEFYQSKDWWWDHHRIRFLKSQTGLSSLLLLIPILVFISLFGMTIFLGMTLSRLLGSDSGLGFALGIAVILIGIPSIVFIAPPATQWIMSGIAWLLKPFQAFFEQHFDRYTEDRCSEFNRQTGLVRFARGRGKPPIVAPFIEFDGYVERVIQRGGVFYKLMLVHRYTGKEFHHTSFSQTVTHKQEVHAQWDMLQRYMDVSQPLPDVPRLEPFRDHDPVTAEHDRKVGRNLRYWRDLDIEAWKENEGADLLKAQMDYPWKKQQCRLTPCLGEIDMDDYLKQAPEASV